MHVSLKFRILAALAAGACILLSVFVLAKVEDFPGETGNSLQIPYAYREPAKPIDDIQLAVFYAVPQNAVPMILEDWKADLASALTDAARFHAVQFRGASKISFVVYPEPFILENPRVYYDTNSTDGGNPRALESVSREIQRRAEEFLSSLPTGFRSVGIIYEGVGASGMNGAFILSRDFITRQEYKSNRASLLYHEFAHTIGLPDQYNPRGETTGTLYAGEAYSDDIMGAGRNDPIENAYLDRKLLQDMGVVFADSP